MLVKEYIGLIIKSPSERGQMLETGALLAGCLTAGYIYCYRSHLDQACPVTQAVI